MLSNNVYALTAIGILYERGSGVIKDHVKAFECFHKAVQIGQ